MRNEIGGLRRSHVVTTYGCGAIIDFRAPKSGAPLSGLLSGLEEWDDASNGRPGLNHPQLIHEARLERRLGVQGFRLPPVKIARAGKTDDSSADVLPVVRFPQWLQCPACSRLKRAEDWNKNPGDPERWCGTCSDEDESVWAVPVRFIVACEDGHLDEFPWSRWVGCECDRAKLELATDGPGLGGKVVRCQGCKRSRSLEGVFQKHSMADLGCFCKGREPWLSATSTSPCQKPLRVLQRGASNVYWGDTQSALDIPPFSPDPSTVFGPYWPALRDAKPEKWSVMIDALDLVTLLGQPLSALLAKLTEWSETASSDDKDEDVEWAEYKQFQRSLTEPVVRPEFETRPSVPPAEFSHVLEGVALARRLREVRAQVGFTRIHPPGGMFRAKEANRGRLSKGVLPWLPAIEMRGEGIFLSFRREAVVEWERRKAVIDHFDRFAKQLWKDLAAEARTPDELAAVRARFDAWCGYGARFVMLHSFSHVFMRRLSLECGYSSSALRERLYVNGERFEMMGVLIHTDSPDSEGTLGGLVRQGKPDRLRDTLSGMLRDAQWCSSDPVCITGTMTLSTPRNGAACHACLLAPETSCQHFNTLLDRALLVGSDERPDVGFLEGQVDANVPRRPFKNFPGAFDTGRLTQEAALV